MLLRKRGSCWRRDSSKSVRIFCSCSDNGMTAPSCLPRSHQATSASRRTPSPIESYVSRKALRRSPKVDIIGRFAQSRDPGGRAVANKATPLAGVLSLRGPHRDWLQSRRVGSNEDTLRRGGSGSVVPLAVRRRAGDRSENRTPLSIEEGPRLARLDS